LIFYFEAIQRVVNIPFFGSFIFWAFLIGFSFDEKLLERVHNIFISSK